MLSRMNDILEIDLEGCTVVVQPGATNLSISEAVSEYGLFYAPDPSSQIACSIGGNVAENAGGVHCLKYGLTLHNVLGVKVQTLGGKELVIGGKSYAHQGIDLLPLIIGSEGLLGVVTEVTLKVIPIPPKKSVLLAAFDQLDQAGEAVAGVIGKGIVPAALELMDRNAIRAAESYAKCGYPLSADAILLCEIDGSEQSVNEESKKVQETFKEHAATSIEVADDPAEQQRLWQGRKGAFPAAGRLAPDYYCMDGTIPRHAISTVLGRITELSKKYDLGVANVFHAGDGNLHPLILYDASEDGELEKAEKFGKEILELCVAVGGTVTGEHGVGIEKLDPMCSQFSSAEIQQFERVKAAFDPFGLMNPGKAIPTLARCSELGGMHVHDGQLPHPEIPRL